MLPCFVYQYKRPKILLCGRCPIELYIGDILKKVKGTKKEDEFYGKSQKTICCRPILHK